MELDDELGNVVGKRDGFCESLLFGPHARELGSDLRNVVRALRDLRLDLVAHMAEHEREHLVPQHMALELMHECSLDFRHLLIDGHGAHGATAVAVARAAIRHDSLGSPTMGSNALRNDRAAALAVRQAGQWIFRGSLLGAHLTRGTGCEPRLYREPRLFIDDPPFGNLGFDHVAWISFDADNHAGLADLLHASMEIDPAVPRIEEDRADSPRRPRATAAPTCGRRRHAIVVETMSNLLDSATREILVIDPADHMGLVLVNDRKRELTSRAVHMAFQFVPKTASARDLAIAHARA